MSIEIGKKVKKLRKVNSLTLQELSDQTDLSTGFLSQLERGMTSIAINSLEKIATALGVKLTYFLETPQSSENHICRRHEHRIFQVESSKFIHYHLSNNLDNKKMLPKIIEVLPSSSDEKTFEYQHNGEEFIYILEGILTIFINHQKYELYPGDSAHFDSSLIHNWANYTNKVVKILAVNIPNPFEDRKK